MLRAQATLAIAETLQGSLDPCASGSFEEYPAGDHQNARHLWTNPPDLDRRFTPIRTGKKPMLSKP